MSSIRHMELTDGSAIANRRVTEVYSEAVLELAIRWWIRSIRCYGVVGDMNIEVLR